MNIRHFLTKLKTFKVTEWGADSSQPTPPPDREAELGESDVISSLIKDWDTSQGEPRHIVVLDIDYPAALIESSTAGHYHLFLDVPGGIPHKAYMHWLYESGKLGICEPGYVDASERRGHSDVRLPWIGKPVWSVPMLVQQPVEPARSVGPQSIF